MVQQNMFNKKLKQTKTNITSCILFSDRASNLYWFSNMDAI